MKKMIQTFEMNLCDQHLPFSWKDTFFFDIETTGFAANNSNLYLIGILHSKDGRSFTSTQFLSEGRNEEAILLYEFFHTIQSFQNMVHFNGNGFDIPYLLTKCHTHNMLYNFNTFHSFDLYKEAYKFKTLFRTQNLKQKTLEEFFGATRTDIYSGKELINIYYDYLSNPSAQKEDMLLLHNFEDLKGMLSLLPVYSYASFLDGNFTYQGYQTHSFFAYDGTENKEILFDFSLTEEIPTRVSCGDDVCYFSLHHRKCTLKVLLHTDELKFFYPDYKNYYYLPKEDCAIHKSVAFYVDKNYRTQAKAATCYSKKTGCFLPEYDEIICPYFKIDYQDKVLYFEADDEFLASPDKIMSYAMHMIHRILNHK